MADWQRDLATIMDAAEIESAVLLGPGHGGHIAVRYALDHPDRVDALILAAAAVQMNAWSNSLMRGVSAENWDLYLRNMVPHTVSSERYNALLQAFHETQTQAEFQVAIREIFRWDLEDDLPRLRKPLLVMHPRGLLTLPVEESQRFAAAVAGSRFVFVNGSEGALVNPAESLAAIDSFIAELNDEPTTAGSPGLKATPNQGLGELIGHHFRVTPREADVLRLIAQGRSNQQIADELVLSVRTVERHITNLYAKIGAHGKAEATAYALRSGLG
jgi:DNA-binding CsgD family transcriptional regulator